MQSPNGTAPTGTIRGYDPDAFKWRGINPDGTPDEDLIRGLAASIVETAKPSKVILFGSAGRGEMKWWSDLDFLVVAEYEHRRLAEIEILKNIPPGPRAVDVVIVRPEAMERKTGAGRFLMTEAEEEGRVLYDAGRV